MTEIKQIKVELLDEMMKSDQKFALIDVREPSEYNSGFIGSAINIPLSEISVEKISNYLDQQVILYCHSGKRSGDAYLKLVKEDPNIDAWNLEGGIVAWKEAGLPVNTSMSHNSNIPLDRQIHLAFSILILIGLVLNHAGKWYGYVFLWIAGIALLNSGLTGKCGIVKLISMMPWNN